MPHPLSDGDNISRAPYGRLRGLASGRGAVLTSRCLGMAALLAATCMAGCTPADKFAPVCPALRLLPDASDVTQYNPGGQDLTDLKYSARITAVPALCAAGDNGGVKAKLKVVVGAIRGPALSGRDIQLPYIVTVMSGDKVLDQQDYVMTGTFPANVDRLQFTSPDISLLLPLATGQSAAAYTIYVSFRLTPEQLQANRRRGPA